MPKSNWAKEAYKTQQARARRRRHEARITLVRLLDNKVRGLIPDATTRFLNHPEYGEFQVTQWDSWGFLILDGEISIAINPRNLETVPQT